MFPIHLNLGFKIIYFYEGIYFAIAIISGILWARTRLKKYQMDVKLWDDMIVIALISAIICGRLFHFLFWEPDVFFKDPLLFFKIWDGGGITIAGGILGGVSAAAIYYYKKNAEFFKMYAIVAPAFLLAQAIGRIGCFLNGDAFGTASNLPWAMQFPRYGISFPFFKIIKNISSFAWQWSYSNGLIDRNSEVSAAVHPTQLYESLGDILLMILILYLLKKFFDNKAIIKSIFFIHTGGYAFLRFLIEFIRGDRTGITKLGISSFQIGLLIYFICSVILAVFINFKSKQKV